MELHRADQALAALDIARTDGADGTDADRSTVARDVLWLCFSGKTGSMRVQDFISSTSIQVNYQELARIMSSRVQDAWDDEHANFVLRKLIFHGDPEALQLIANAILGRAAKCARSRIGCRVLIDFIEEDRQGVDSAPIKEELLAHSRSLIEHPYGHHVIKAMLDYARDPVVVRTIARWLMERLRFHARQRHASQVIEKVLETAAVWDPICKYGIEVGLAALTVELSSHAIGHHLILHLLLYGADFTMEDLRQSEEDGGQTRHAHFKSSGIRGVCARAGLETLPTHETLPSDIAAELLTTREAQGHTFRHEILEVLAKMRQIAPQQQAASSQSARQQQRRRRRQRQLQAGSPQGLPLRPPPAFDSDVNADLVDVDMEIAAVTRPPVRQQIDLASGVETRAWQ